MNDWVMLILPKVFTRIKTQFSENVKTKYGMTDVNFTTVGSNDTPAVFPFVYVQLLPALETGRDLEGTSINGGTFTFQIDVIDNKSQSNTREVMSEVVRIMKTMGFEVNSMPNYVTTQDKTHRMTARFRRSIDKNDFIKWRY